MACDCRQFAEDFSDIQLKWNISTPPLSTILIRFSHTEAPELRFAPAAYISLAGMRLHGGLLRRKINRALLRSFVHKGSTRPVQLHNKNSSMVMGREEDRVLSTGYSRVSLSPWRSLLTSLRRPHRAPKESGTQLATVQTSLE